MTRSLFMAVFALQLFASGAAAAGRIPKPMIEPARGEKCIAPPERMRREHMELLRHQRDETVLRGVRGAQASLQQCVECHASRTSGSVAARREDFCVSCHAYAGVKLDCFECHTPKPKGAATVPATGAGGNAR